MSLSFDVLFYTPIVFIILYLLLNKMAKTPRNICIVVLGDIGRSPRMQYHALSFAKEGFRVYLVGYKGTKPHETLLSNENIQISYVKEPPAVLAFAPKLMGYFLKVIWQSVLLLWTLLLLPKMGSILIQNPPSIPTMLIAYMVSFVRFSTLVIDWHNYGHTILSMALKKDHPLVRFAEWYEKRCGRLSSYNICVTNAMRDDLKTNWNINAITAHDRPSEIFQSASLEKQNDLFTRLAKEYSVFASSESAESDSTKFTARDQDGNITKLVGRPALLVSSTSWTDDEDFGILLEALEAYDEADEDGKSSKLPDLLCVITGKGPQKAFYSRKIEERSWKKIQFCLPWLAAEDYPTMLGSADVGVCLHMSSSGLDLPMKVVDMFGCGLPVCAVNFKCIGELVKHDKNGLIFNDSQELVSQLKQILEGFPDKNSKLESYRRNLASFQELRWHSQWKLLVLPIFLKIGGIRDSAFDIPGLFDQTTRTEDTRPVSLTKEKDE
ncbi:unnamed protein product [Lymnaea stagnalis]|uniref:Chitobiosyldiphosphodolichol beta-mannosyltransferase n=1 Tax=Lymnaea stagnalis TaxID=6523 RepID=A0AAV2I5I0_LYMST